MVAFLKLPHLNRHECPETHFAEFTQQIILFFRKSSISNKSRQQTNCDPPLRILLRLKWTVEPRSHDRRSSTHFIAGTPCLRTPAMKHSDGDGRKGRGEYGK